MAEDSEVYVFGSQSILGQFPTAPNALRASAEADVMPKNFPERVDEVDGALGELSQFHRTFGFYVHGISIEAAILPEGWEERCVVVQNENTRNKAGLCLEAHDLAASKLVAFRDKDRAFVRTLLKESLVDPEVLAERLQASRLDGDARSRLLEWIRTTAGDLAGGVV